MRKRQIAAKAVLVLLILVFSFIAVYSAIQIVSSLVLSKYEIPGEEAAKKTVVKDGVEYFPRQDISVFLLAGIDRTGPVQTSPSYNNSGAADMLALVIMDDTNKNLRVLMLNRDTMLDVPVLGIGGSPAGTVYGQLALAHTYGTGMEDSCENVKNAIGNLLGLHAIDYYMSMNMDTVSLLADAVGGVPVTVTDDFSAVDPSIPLGETVLNGSQALHFVQGRSGVGDQLNLSRMDRHRAFMNGFVEAANRKMDENSQFAIELYEKISDYIVTDCSATSFSSLLDRCADYQLAEVISPAGENKIGDEFMEFYADETALEDLVLRLFYSEKMH